MTDIPADIIDRVKPWVEGMHALYVCNRDDHAVKRKVEKQLGLKLSWYTVKQGKTSVRVQAHKYDLVIAANHFLSRDVDADLRDTAKAAGIPYIRAIKGRPTACAIALQQTLGLDLNATPPDPEPEPFTPPEVRHPPVPVEPAPSPAPEPQIIAEIEARPVRTPEPNEAAMPEPTENQRVTRGRLIKITPYMAATVDRLRQERNWTHKQLADAAGCSQARISTLCKGSSSMRSVREDPNKQGQVGFPILCQVAHALQVDVSYLFEPAGASEDHSSRAERLRAERPSDDQICEWLEGKKNFTLEQMLADLGMDLPRKPADGGVNWGALGRYWIRQVTDILRAAGFVDRRVPDGTGARKVRWILVSPETAPEPPPPPPKPRPAPAPRRPERPAEAVPAPQPRPAPENTAPRASHGGSLTLHLDQIEGDVNELLRLLTDNGWKVAITAR